MAKDQISKLKFEELYTRIEKGGIDPIYFLNGSEEYLKIEFLKLLRRKLFGDSQASANVEKIFASAGSAPTIIDLVSDYSLFSGGRLVIVYDVQRISQKGQEMLLSFFTTIPSGNHIVLFGPPSFDRRPKFYKYLTTEAIWSTLTGLNERSAPFWIKKRFAKQGIKITQEALNLLLRYVGNSYGLLGNQLDKLAIALGDKEVLDIEDVKKHTTSAAEYEVFAFLDFVERGDRVRALEALNRLLEKSDGVGSILFWLSERFFPLYYISSNYGSMSEGELAGQLRMSPYRVRKLLDTAREKSTGFFEKSIKAITQAEVSLRFDHIPPRLILENLVISLTGSNSRE